MDSFETNEHNDINIFSFWCKLQKLACHKNCLFQRTPFWEYFFLQFGCFSQKAYFSFHFLKEFDIQDWIF